MHQELPTRTHPDHCSDGSQQPDCHKARLLQQPFGRLHQTVLISCNEYLYALQELYSGDSRHHVIPLHRYIICTGCGLGSTSCSNFAFWCTRQSMAWHCVIPMNCACQFRLFLAFLFLVLLPVEICLYPGQGYNLAKGILCGWSGRLDIRSAPSRTLSTFKNMLKTHLFSRSYITD